MVEGLRPRALLRLIQALADEDPALLRDVLPKDKLSEVIGKVETEEEWSQEEEAQKIERVLQLVNLPALRELVDLEENGGGFTVRVCKQTGAGVDILVTPRTTVLALQKKVEKAMIEKALAPHNTNWFVLFPFAF